MSPKRGGPKRGRVLRGLAGEPYSGGGKKGGVFWGSKTGQGSKKGVLGSKIDPPLFLTPKIPLGKRRSRYDGP